MASLLSWWICYLDDTIYRHGMKLKTIFSTMNINTPMLYSSSLFVCWIVGWNGRLVCLPREDMRQCSLVLSLQVWPSVINIIPYRVLKVIPCSTMTRWDISTVWSQGVRLKMRFKSILSPFHSAWSWMWTYIVKPSFKAGRFYNLFYLFSSLCFLLLVISVNLSPFSSAIR